MIKKDNLSEVSCISDGVVRIGDGLTGSFGDHLAPIFDNEEGVLELSIGVVVADCCKVVLPHFDIS